MWTTNDNDFKRCNDIYNSLNDKRNCILKLNNDLYSYDKKEAIILPFQPDLKFIHKILQKMKPVYQIKWGALYGEDINWE